jgi:hypothetical protein
VVPKVAAVLADAVYDLVIVAEEESPEIAQIPTRVLSKGFQIGLQGGPAKTLLSATHPPHHAG